MHQTACRMPCAACSMRHTIGVPLQLHGGRRARGGRVRRLGGRRVARAAGAPLHGVPCAPAAVSPADARTVWTAGPTCPRGTRAARGVARTVRRSDDGERTAVPCTTTAEDRSGMPVDSRTQCSNAATARRARAQPVARFNGRSPSTRGTTRWMRGTRVRRCAQYGLQLCSTSTACA